MRHSKSISFLVVLIIICSALATSMGILTDEGPGSFDHESIRGETVEIYGKGVYKHMSAEVAPQGIAQDYVTLLLAIPLLILSLIYARKGSLKARFMLAGVLGYFLVTYLFYLIMGMYNILFLIYILLLMSSFFAFSITLFTFDLQVLHKKIKPGNYQKWAGGFLIFNSLAIAFLWLSIIVPPLFEGSIIPVQVEHYTTLVVQGLDLGLLLPLAFASGYLFIKKHTIGFLMAPVYLIFLSILMIALIAKIIAMASAGYTVIPAIFIIPLFALAAVVSSVSVLQNMDA